MLSPEADGTIRSFTIILQMFNCLSQCGSSNLALKSTCDLSRSKKFILKIEFGVHLLGRASLEEALLTVPPSLACLAAILKHIADSRVVSRQEPSSKPQASRQE